MFPLTSAGPTADTRSPLFIVLSVIGAGAEVRLVVLATKMVLVVPLDSVKVSEESVVEATIPVIEIKVAVSPVATGGGSGLMVPGVA